MPNLSKLRWNASHYSQVKISINPEIASAFKVACSDSDVSMASVLSGFMADYCHIPIIDKTHSYDLSKRRHRRRIVKELVLQLEQLLIAEELYRDNFPENLHGSKWHDAAEHSIDVLQGVIELLDEVYEVN